MKFEELLSSLEKNGNENSNAELKTSVACSVYNSEYHEDDEDEIDEGDDDDEEEEEDGLVELEL